MEVVFLRSFLVDISKLNDKRLKTKIKEFIVDLEKSSSLEELRNVKK